MLLLSTQTKPSQVFMIRLLPFVHNFKIFPFNKAAHFRFPCQYCSYKFSCDLLLCFVWMCHVPLLKTQFALTAEQKHKLHLKRKVSCISLVYKFEFSHGGGFYLRWLEMFRHVSSTHSSSHSLTPKC